mgnify:CR=1 FL=1
MLETDMEGIVDLVDEVIKNHDNDVVLETVAKRVYEMMSHRPLFKI